MKGHLQTASYDYFSFLLHTLLSFFDPSDEIHQRKVLVIVLRRFRDFIPYLPKKPSEFITLEHAIDSVAS